MKDAFDTVEEFWDHSALASAQHLAEKSGVELVKQFESVFLDQLGGQGLAVFVSSGREALRLALTHYKTERKIVLISNFNCPVVYDAVAEAGFQPKGYDFSPLQTQLDWRAIFSTIGPQNIAAVIVPHLFGLPVDIHELRQLTVTHGVLLIEDCAHTLGANVGGVPVGTLGDVSVFSFNYDKPISLLGGGMLVCNSSSIDMSKIRAGLTVSNLNAEKREIEKFYAWLAYRRSNICMETRQASLVKRKLKKIPFLQKWISPQYLDFKSIASVSRGKIHAALGLQQLPKYPKVREIRNINYALFKEFVCANNLGELLSPHSPEIAPAWLKAKLILRDELQSSTDALGRYLSLLGFRVGRFNWGYVLSEKRRLEVVQPSINQSSRFAALSLDFPIHQRLQNKDLEIMNRSILSWLP